MSCSEAHTPLLKLCGLAITSAEKVQGETTKRDTRDVQDLLSTEREITAVAMKAAAITKCACSS